MNTIQDNTVVQFSYKLTVDGEEVESNLLEYLHGHGNIIPGLENELAGMQEGESKKVWCRLLMHTESLTPPIWWLRSIAPRSRRILRSVWANR